MSEHFYGDQCPGGHADNPEIVRAHVAAVEQEMISYRDRHMRMLTTERQRDDDTRAAARRMAWEHCLNSLRPYLVGEALQPLWGLVQCAEAVIERGAGRSQAHTDGLSLLSSRVHFAKAALCEVDRGAEAAGGGMFAELRRLREFIRVQGARLHEEHGQDRRGPGDDVCRCPGCELIRAADDGQPVRAVAA